MNDVGDVRDALLGAWTTQPVHLERIRQKLALRNVITFSANEMSGNYDDLPEGIWVLRNALQDDLPAGGRRGVGPTEPRDGVALPVPGRDKP